MTVAPGFRPLHDAKVLPKGWKKQLTGWLQDQGAGTVAQAARDEEWRDLWAAELSVGPRTFHVALTGTGDGAVWEGDDAVPVADVVQHHGEVCLDAEVVQALDAALASAGPPARIRLSPASADTAPRPPVFAGDLSARLDELQAAFDADPKDRAT